MLNKLKQRKEAGFTIIEVMIVLAIAGLIMIVVFLAVPALQRSSRNNSVDTSANALLTGVGEFAAANNGVLPNGPNTITSSSSGNVTLTGAGTASSVPVKVGDNVKVVVGGTAWTNATVAGAVGPPAQAAKTPGDMQIITGTTAKCNDTANGISGSANARSYVVLYVAETAGGVVLKCIG